MANDTTPIVLATVERDGVRYQLVCDAVEPSSIEPIGGEFRTSPQVLVSKADD